MGRQCNKCNGGHRFCDGYNQHGLTCIYHKKANEQAHHQRPVKYMRGGCLSLALIPVSSKVFVGNNVSTRRDNSYDDGPVGLY